MAILDFTEIPQANTGNGDQDTFELFARDFLEIAGFRIIEPPNRGADGKKDMIVEEARHGHEGETKIRWLVSAKHYAHSKKAINDTIEPNVEDRVGANNCNGFIGFYSTLPTNSLMGVLEGLKKHKNIEYSIYDWSRIEGKIISDYNPRWGCYSIALFRSIEAKIY